MGHRFSACIANNRYILVAPIVDKILPIEDNPGATIPLVHFHAVQAPIVALAVPDPSPQDMLPGSLVRKRLEALLRSRTHAIELVPYRATRPRLPCQ